MKRVSEFGRKWNVKVPRRDIYALMGATHVSTSVEEIEADITRRCMGKPGFTDGIIKQSVDYALECHRRNRDLYQRVMSGRLK